MTDLFDHAAAQAAKLAAMTRSETNANPTWADTMLELVRLTCREQLYFTADDIFDRVEAMPNMPKTHDLRAFGPVMKKAASAGYCEKTDRVRESSRAKLHASPRAIWRSKLYAQ